MYTYLEMKESIIFALANYDYQRLSRLRIMDHNEFDEVIKNLEKEMGIDLSKEIEQINV